MPASNPIDIDKLYKKWIRAQGEAKINLKWPSLKGLYDWFLRQTKSKGVDPETIDFEMLVDPSLTYLENKTLLAEMIRAPPTEKDYELMFEETKALMEKEVRDLFPEIIEPLEEKIAKLERVKDRAERYSKLVKELKLELDETKRRLEEEREKPPEIAPVKIRVLKPFTEGILDYTAGSVIETRDINWALDKIEKGFAERVPLEIPVEVAVPPTELTDDEKKRLADVFKAVLFKELGKVPANALAVFRVELEQVKMTPYEEAKKAVEALAQEIIRTEALRKKIKVAKPPRPPKEIIRPPPVREEMVLVGRIPPAYPPKEPDPEAVPFPRAPSSKERIEFEKAFRYRLQERGISYLEFLKQFESYIAGTVFKSWKHLLKNYELFVDAILKGQRLPPLVLWQGFPISFGLRPLLREEPDERTAFREVLEDYRYNSVVKATTVVLKNAEYLLEKATLEKIMETLDEQYGITGLTKEDIRDILTHAWKNKEQLPVPWFTRITLEDLNGLFET